MLKRLAPILLLTAVCWVVFLLNNIILGGHLTQYAIRPRHLSSLPGILWSPFLHLSFHHLAANTVPLLILGGIICVRGRAEFALVTAIGILFTGVLVWLIGRSAYHIGASGLIFCFFGYLASLAWFERKIGTLVLSVLCVLGYGGMLRGLLPTSAAVSWEGHLAGLLAGIVLAWLRSEIRPAKPPVTPSGSSS